MCVSRTALSAKIFLGSCCCSSDKRRARITTGFESRPGFGRMKQTQGRKEAKGINESYILPYPSLEFAHRPTLQQLKGPPGRR